MMRYKILLPLLLCLYYHSFAGTVYAEENTCGCQIPSRKSTGFIDDYSLQEDSTNKFCSGSTLSCKAADFISDGKTINLDKDGIKARMVYIPGGFFNMGTNRPYIYPDGESPRRKVYLSPFYLDIYEVSNDDFLAFVKDTNYLTDSEKYGWSFVFATYVPERIKRHITQAVLGGI